MSETIAATQTRIETFILENFPVADIAPGSVLSETIVKLSSQIDNMVYSDVGTVSQGNNIAAAQASSTDTYSTAIDSIASNYLVTRNSGTVSTGLLQVNLSSPSYVYLNVNNQFQQPATGLLYNVSQTWIVSAAPSASNELQLYASGSAYFFLLPVVAADVGSAYQLTNGTSVVSLSTISNLLSITAYGNFSSGVDKETDKALIARLQAGMTNKSMTSKMAILSKLSSANASIQDVSVVGAGDAEMTRSKQNLFGISTFGMSDVYLRSTNGVSTLSFNKLATKTADNTWSFTLDYNDVAGFYDILSVQPVSAVYSGSVVINSVTYGVSRPNDPAVNQINNVAEARFTQYQNCTVVFTYTETPTLAVLATMPFLVSVNYQPFVRDSQLTLNATDTRLAAADYLVKAAVPCYLSIKLQLQQNGTAVVPVSSIQQDIFNYVNSLSFGEPLYASQIIKICHNYSSVKHVVTPVNMSGSILAPSGATLNVSSVDSLTIPLDIANGVSPKNTSFFTSYGVAGTGISIVVQ